MICLSSWGETSVNGWRVFTVSNSDANLDEPNDLRGQVIELDGREVRVTAVETFQIGRPYPRGFQFVIVVEPR